MKLTPIDPFKSAVEAYNALASKLVEGADKNTLHLLALMADGEDPVSFLESHGSIVSPHQAFLALQGISGPAVHSLRGHLDKALGLRASGSLTARAGHTGIPPVNNAVVDHVVTEIRGASENIYQQRALVFSLVLLVQRDGDNSYADQSLNNLIADNTVVLNAVTDIALQEGFLQPVAKSSLHLASVVHADNVILRAHYLATESLFTPRQDTHGRIHYHPLTAPLEGNDLIYERTINTTLFHAAQAGDIYSLNLLAQRLHPALGSVILLQSLAEGEGDIAIRAKEALKHLPVDTLLGTVQEGGATQPLAVLSLKTLAAQNNGDAQDFAPHIALGDTRFLPDKDRQAVLTVMGELGNKAAQQLTTNQPPQLPGELAQAISAWSSPVKAIGTAGSGNTGSGTAGSDTTGTQVPTRLHAGTSRQLPPHRYEGYTPPGAGSGYAFGVKALTPAGGLEGLLEGFFEKIGIDARAWTQAPASEPPTIHITLTSLGNFRLVDLVRALTQSHNDVFLIPQGDGLSKIQRPLRALSIESEGYVLATLTPDRDTWGWNITVTGDPDRIQVRYNERGVVTKVQVITATSPDAARAQSPNGIVMARIPVTSGSRDTILEALRRDAERTGGILLVDDTSPPVALPKGTPAKVGAPAPTPVPPPVIPEPLPRLANVRVNASMMVLASLAIRSAQDATDAGDTGRAQAFTNLATLLNQGTALKPQLAKHLLASLQSLKSAIRDAAITGHIDNVISWLRVCLSRNFLIQLLSQPVQGVQEDKGEAEARAAVLDLMVRLLQKGDQITPAEAYILLPPLRLFESQVDTYYPERNEEILHHVATVRAWLEPIAASHTRSGSGSSSPASSSGSTSGTPTSSPVSGSGGSQASSVTETLTAVLAERNLGFLMYAIANLQADDQTQLLDVLNFGNADEQRQLLLQLIPEAATEINSCFPQQTATANKSSDSLQNGALLAAGASLTTTSALAVY